jgi:hypothetical protein
MAIQSAVAVWRCSCGARVKVIGEVDPDAALTGRTVNCPQCGEGKILYIEKITSVILDTPQSSGGVFVE